MPSFIEGYGIFPVASYYKQIYCEHLYRDFCENNISIHFSRVCLTSYKITKPFFRVAIPFCILISDVWEFQFLVSIFSFNHSDRVILISNWCLYQRLPNGNDVFHVFTSAILLSSLGKSLVKSFAHFLMGCLLLLSFDLFKNISWTHDVCQKSDLQTFSPHLQLVSLFSWWYLKPSKFFNCWGPNY